MDQQEPVQFSIKQQLNCVIGDIISYYMKRGDAPCSASNHLHSALGGLVVIYETLYDETYDFGSGGLTTEEQQDVVDGIAFCKRMTRASLLDGTCLHLKWDDSIRIPRQF